MNLVQSILYIYPTLENGKDFEVVDRNDKKGPVLTWLSKTITKPTQAEITTAWEQVLILQQAEKDKLFKKEAISKIATLSDQLNLIATVLDRITEGTTDPIVISAKAKFGEIKAILVK